VVVSVLNTVSSNNASADDTFAFQATQDVVINGYVVIKKGAPGQGTITAVDGAASNGHAGKLAMRFDYVMSTDGLKIPLTVYVDHNVHVAATEASGTVAGYAR